MKQDGSLANGLATRYRLKTLPVRLKDIRVSLI